MPSNDIRCTTFFPDVVVVCMKLFPILIHKYCFYNVIITSFTATKNHKPIKECT